MNTPILSLLYHRVDNSGRPFSTPVEVFRAHMSWLANQGYRSLSREEFDSAVLNSGSRAPRRFLLTFDDGFTDLRDNVAPILRDHGFQATAFLITSRCPHDDEHGEYLSWPAIRALAGTGLFEFHTHTNTHQRWPLADGSASTVQGDIDDSLAVLRHELRMPARHFGHIAWPFGRTIPSWEEAASRIGLRTQHIVQKGAVTHPGGTIRLPRLMADGMPLATMQAWVSGLSRPAGAAFCNLLFGTIRHFRQGAGYR
jgi:peptidoglycan/xylan/chitin deacetylase (PgdA/CDA1 family)